MEALETLKTSPEMVKFIMGSNTYSPIPYVEDIDVKIGYGHKIPKTWLLKEDLLWTKEQSIEALLKDLKKIERMPFIRELEEGDKILYDFSVHFIFDHGLQPYKNCGFEEMVKQGDYKEILNTLSNTLLHFKGTPYFKKRVFDVALLTAKSYNKGKLNGHKERILKKNVSFGCRA